ncbi:transcriptional regulator PdhR [Pseudidiomarina salinarum]|uniref:Pyruvate dehydrogenase complex repressor n=1 Tax=Pseudidiomarina salinarum TaxID=435908 RepID=A0A094L8V1_9GAMM|nr:pyruvate dehydrogenase complex transcriptional repressor PdhR [Pseudidiomarina salinarum]KFZ31253.1 transcriptional regulator PdhR [Pseudidiomarina salinarum]RUO70998.1 pyruvate dehydrogenase complex transcriptional repressor PdhR [Pseudidiomarina salinarum]
MAFERIQQTKLSDVIMERIEAMIVDGTLAAGARLPSERDLAHKFSVSRPSLREAIQKLEARGLLERRQGGGTYVCDNMQQRVAEPLLELLAKHPESQFDLLEFRHALEGISSYYAALRGTAQDLEQIEQSFRNIAEDPGAELKAQAQALVDFNLRICEASHNVILLHLVRSMQPLLVKNIEQNLQDLAHKPGIMQQLHEHRRQIVAAITAGEPEQAREACHQLLAYIEHALLTSNREQSRIQRSLRRTQTG